MIYHDVEQGSSEWFALRKGVPTASNFDRILTPVKAELSKSATKYAFELIGETLSTIPEEGIEDATTRSMRWGQYCEEEARRFYAMERDVAVANGGFCRNGSFGSSPDGIIGLEAILTDGEIIGHICQGALELKCPQPGTQVQYLLEGILPTEYKCQVHGHLIVTGAEWCDFLSYSPGLPALLIRVYPDAFTQQLRAGLEAFDGLLKAAWEKVRAA